MKAVSKTAWYCCGVRMQDAASPNPLINDQYAGRLLGEEGRKYFREFSKFKKQNASNIARHYIIDNHLRQALHHHPDSTIILIGAGLDSRAYRLPGGKWVEIDEQALIAYKNDVLPVSECKNQLERIAIDFEKETLAAKLSPFADRPEVLFIIEGVLMYLGRDQKETLLKTLTTLFPKHTVYCDLMNKKFFEKLGKDIHQKFVEQNTSFTDIMDEPEQLFLQHGYHKTDVISIVRASVDAGLTHIPKFILNTFMKKLLMGYSIYTFSYRN